MKKIVTLIFSFIMLFSLTACGSPDELYGYWKSEKNTNFFSGQPEVIVISENIFGVDKQKFKNITYEKDGDLWTTSELTKVLGVPISFSFKIIDKNTIEVIENGGNQFKEKGKYTRITEEEAKKIEEYSPWKNLKSKNDPF